jgi:hypothetical protein
MVAEVVERAHAKMGSNMNYGTTASMSRKGLPDLERLIGELGIIPFFAYILFLSRLFLVLVLTIVLTSKITNGKLI